MSMRVLVVLGAMAVFAGCASSGGSGGSSEVAAVAVPTETSFEYVRLETTLGDIVIELDPDHAPITVANFLHYVDTGAYDGTIFHRVIPGFVVQGGGYNTDLVELSSGDPIALEWPNGLSNSRGTIGMARDAAPDTATRQFYVNVADNARLDRSREVSGGAGYAVFGRVVDGMHVVDLIRDGKTTSLESMDMEDVPVEPVVLIGARRMSDSDAARYWR